MIPLLGQLHALVVMVAAGVILGVLFDFYRVIRSVIRPGSSAGMIFDIVFWVVATPATFLLLLAGNWGQLRLYVFLGMAAGLFAYFQLVSPLVVWGLISWLRWLGRILAKIVALFAFIGRCWPRRWPEWPAITFNRWRSKNWGSGGWPFR